MKKLLVLFLLTFIFGCSGRTTYTEQINIELNLLKENYDRDGRHC